LDWHRRAWRKLLTWSSEPSTGNSGGPTNKQKDLLVDTVNLIFAAVPLVAYWPLTTDCGLLADGRFRGEADMLDWMLGSSR
jgi:hypothetical protein